MTLQVTTANFEMIQFILKLSKYVLKQKSKK